MRVMISAKSVVLVAASLALVSCASVEEESIDSTGPAIASAHAEEAATVGAVLDDFHAAAAVADGPRYFAHFASEGVFLGTDATERWTVEQFRAYCEPYFSAGKGWKYDPLERHVDFAPGGTLAWFDERLMNAKYGETRGSGVLRRIDGAWKIVQYNLTFTVPNEKASRVVEAIRAD